MSYHKKNMNTPVNPSFTTQKWGVMGYTLHGHVIMMYTYLYTNACLFLNKIIMNNVKSKSFENIVLVFKEFR